MKSSKSHRTPNPGPHPGRPGAVSFLPHIGLLPLLITLLAPEGFSQSASSFDTKPIATPQPVRKSLHPKKETPATAAKIGSAETSTGPSRYVSETDLDAYVASLSAAFSMKGRATDPFGQYQDPDAKPIVKATVAKATRRAAPIQATPFSEIVRRIQVTTIMPGERRFLVGTRSFKQGDQFPISFRGRNITVEVSSVNSRQIEFRNVENAETASLKLNLLPVGMTPGTGGISAPGMVPERANAPLEIEAGDSSPETSQN